MKEHTYVLTAWVRRDVSIQIKSELDKPELLEELLSGKYQEEIKKQIKSMDLDLDFGKMSVDDIKEV